MSSVRALVRHRAASSAHPEDIVPCLVAPLLLLQTRNVRGVLSAPARKQVDRAPAPGYADTVNAPLRRFSRQ